MPPRIYEGGAPLGAGGVIIAFFLYCFIYHGTHRIEILIYICIAKTDYFQSKFFQIFCAKNILFLTFWIVMSSAVQFYYQFRLKTVEICYKIADTFLPLKADWIVF